MNQKPEKTQILLKLKSDMLLFGKICLPSMFTLPSPVFHHELAGMFMDKSLRRMNVIAPRGHAKSSVGACVFPLHHIFFDKGQKVVVLASKTQGHAVELLQTIKDALDFSMPLRSLFGYWGRHSARIWTKDKIVLKDGSAVVCKGTGQQIHGLKLVHQRPTLIVLDDPEDANNTKTNEAMEWNLRWLLRSCEPALDAQTGRLLVIGTPQHERCIVETLKDMGSWTTKHYQALTSNGKQALWPEQMSVEELLNKKAALEEIGRVSSFYSEYQCRVVGDEDQLITEDQLCYYDGVLDFDDYGNTIMKIKEPFEKNFPVHVFIGVDPASSTRQTADYSTVVPVAVDHADNRYVLPYYRQRVKPVDLADAVIGYFSRYKPKWVNIETVGYQEMLRDYIRRRSEELGIFIPGLEFKNNPRTAKSVRLESMQPHFYRKKVFIQKNMPELKDELLLYPRGKHDDLLDGLYYAMLKVYVPEESEVTTELRLRRAGLRTHKWTVL